MSYYRNYGISQKIMYKNWCFKTKAEEYNYYKMDYGIKYPMITKLKKKI